MHCPQQLTKILFCKLISLGLSQTASEVGISQIKKKLEIKTSSDLSMIT